MSTGRPKMSPRRPQEAKNEAQEGPRRGQKGPREGQNEPPEAPGAKRVKNIDFWTPQSPLRHDTTALLGVRLEKKLGLGHQKCCTVALFREKTFKSFGLAAF